MVREPLIEAGTLPDAQDRTARAAQVPGCRYARSLQQRAIGATNIEPPAAKGVDCSNRRCGRVAVHHAGGTGQMRPAIPLSAILLGLVEEGLREIRTNLGVDQGDQLHL